MQNLSELNYNQLITLLPPRLPTAHKGDFGHVLIIGGDFGYQGAPILAALGALRVGAGLVTVASHQEHLFSLAATYPEIMCCAIDNVKSLSNILKRASVVVLGPGLGRSKWSQKVFASVNDTVLPLVLDADGLFFLAQKPTQNNNRVLTPHAGEAARLLNQTNAIMPESRLHILDQLLTKYAGTIVLKGAGTLIATAQHEIGICKYGNPGMASGGMGDLLSGMIAGLIAQNLSLDIAAKLAVCVHALAADTAANTGQRGIIATDLLLPIKQLVK